MKMETFEHGLVGVVIGVCLSIGAAATFAILKKRGKLTARSSGQAYYGDKVH
jgi:hypothetical protein